VILAGALATIAPARLQTILRSSGISVEALKTYGLDQVLSLDPGHLVGRLIEFASDLAFKGPIELVKSQVPADRLFAYRWERPNMWAAGPLSGTPHHTIDLLYLAGVPFRIPSVEPEIDQGIATKMINAWVAFGNGREPWPAYSENQTELLVSREGIVECVATNHSLRSARDLMVKELYKDPKNAMWLNAVLSNGAIRY